MFLSSIFMIQPILSSPNNETSLNSLNLRDLSQWWWADLELITDYSTDTSSNVRVAVDGDDNLHVCWRDTMDYLGSGIDNDVFYRKFNANTNSWEAVELVSTESNEHGDYPAITVDVLGNVHVVWSDSTPLDDPATDYDIFYKVKDISSGLWLEAEIVSSSSLDHSFYPDIAVDSLGNAHVVWLDGHNYDGTDTDIIYKVRDAVLETWSAFTVISSESNGVSYNPVIAVDNSDIIHVSWNDQSIGMYGSGADRDVFYKKWDPINSWSEGFTLSYESTDDSFYPYIAFDDSDSIHIAWIDTTDINGAGSDYDVFYRKWDSSSQTWSTSYVISTESSSTSTNAALVVDSYSITHFVWIDSSNIANSGFDEDIYYRSLDTETGSYSDIVLLSSSSDDHSYTPEIGKDSKDHLHVFMKEYDDLLGSGTDGDLFYRKYVGPPESPILAAFNPNTKTIGNLTLNWSPTLGAQEYKIYRSTSYIWDVEYLTLIDTSVGNTFIDEILDAGGYYYAIVASSLYGDSGISNIVSIELTDMPPSDDAPGLFDSIDWGEIIILGGILGALQIIFAVVVVATKSASKPSGTSNKGKKK